MSNQPTTPPPPPYGPDDTRQLPSGPPPPTPPRRGRGFTVGVALMALLVGAGAGFGGAALYSALDDEPDQAADTSGSQASQVVDSGDEPSAPGSVQAVADEVLPSVVRLDVAGSEGRGSGSGIVLSADGEILTNEHVVAVAGDGGEIVVTFNDGTRADATVTGTDPLTDTALIQAEDVEGLDPITIGKSENLDVGDRVVAVGSPFGLDSTVTSGIVSALNRPVSVGRDAEGNSAAYPAVQTDAAINPGNSGGALVNMNGDLVGINSSIRTAGGEMGGAGSIGLGFAIPIDEVRPIIGQMRDGEEPTHARLGITVRTAGAAQQQPEGGPAPGDPFGGEQEPDLGLEVADGAAVVSVNEGSTAEEAGLQQGDVITKVDDHPITSADSLVALIRSYRPGDEVEVTYERDDEQETTTLTLDSDAD